MDLDSMAVLVPSTHLGEKRVQWTEGGERGFLPHCGQAWEPSGMEALVPGSWPAVARAPWAPAAKTTGGQTAEYLPPLHRAPCLCSHSCPQWSLPMEETFKVAPEWA